MAQKIGKSASWGTIANWGIKFKPWTDGFFEFVGGKNLTSFSALNDL